MAAPKLSRRALGRATLERQLLLDRGDVSVPAAIEHLVGLQAQTTHSWYVGLWSRLHGVDASAVGAALEARELVRLPVMRSTIHLVTAADAPVLRALTQPVIERSTMGVFGRRLAGVDRDGLIPAARALLGEGPLTAAELGRGLAPLFPGADPEALAQAARAWLPMVQVPPRGVWGRSGRARQTPLDEWLVGSPNRVTNVQRLVGRYLAAFGPATVRDAQTWCGLTRLSEVFDVLRPGLAVIAGEDGAELFDLPDAPRPGPDVPAPARFLYDYDNLLLSHADRRRIFGDAAGAAYAAQGYTAEANRQPSALLLDGVVAGTWTAARDGSAAVLDVRGFGPLTRGRRAEVEAEGAALLAFLHPGRTADVRVL